MYLYTLQGLQIPTIGFRALLQSPCAGASIMHYNTKHSNNYTVNCEVRMLGITEPLAISSSHHNF